MLRLIPILVAAVFFWGCASSPTAKYPELNDPKAIVGMRLEDWKQSRGYYAAGGDAYPRRHLQMTTPDVIDGVQYDDVGVRVYEWSGSLKEVRQFIVASRNGAIVDVAPNKLMPGETTDPDQGGGVTSIRNRDGSYTNVITHPSGGVYISR